MIFVKALPYSTLHWVQGQEIRIHSQTLVALTVSWDLRHDDVHQSAVDSGTEATERKKENPADQGPGFS